MRPVQFPTAAEGIARERALLAAARPAILIWQPLAPALVIPESWTRRDGVRAAEAPLAAAGWPLVARASGGGAVPQGPCTLNLAVVLPLAPGFRIETGYHLICGMLSEALTRFEIDADTGPVEGAFCDGAWNITVGGRKLAGTAQRWRAGNGTGAALLHAALQLAPLPASAWAALDTLHQVAGLSGGPCPQAHATLADLIPETMRVAAFAGALARAAEDRLSLVLTERQLAARAA